jgi:hypothetical protein
MYDTWNRSMPLLRPSQIILSFTLMTGNGGLRYALQGGPKKSVPATT